MTEFCSEDESAPTFELKVKTIKETYHLQVKECSSIEKLKLQLSEKVNQPVEKICLIFSGKILKDHETLKQHKIGDGMVIHMVVKSQAPLTPSRESTPSSASSSAPTGGGASATPSGATAGAAPPSAGGAFPSAGPYGGIGAMLNNPVVQEMMNSPLMEGLLNNPNVTEVMRNMLTENPQFQQIIQNNPELGHLLNDPRIMQQTIEMIRNPNMFNELLRNHDQALRNIQGIPGGEAALHRMYNEVQEPLMNSMLGDPGAGYAANNNGTNAQNDPQNASSRSQHAGVENAEALPNPWSRVVNQSQQNAASGGAAGGMASGQAGGAPHFASMMNSPGMQSLLRQILANPEALQSLISPANMRNFGQMVGNPAMADQLRTMLGGANPQLLQAMTNPRVSNALAQMHQAMQVLHEECPQVFPNLFAGNTSQNFGGMAGFLSRMWGQQQQQPATASLPPSTTTTSNAPSNVGGTGGIAPSSTPLQPGTTSNTTTTTTPPTIPAGFAELLGSIAMMNMGNQNAGAGAPLQPPEERYRAQLEQLVAMGFTDPQSNVQALIASFGDVNMAIERLLGGGGGGGNAPTGGGGDEGTN